MLERFAFCPAFCHFPKRREFVLGDGFFKPQKEFEAFAAERMGEEYFGVELGRFDTF